jgi:allantoin racemase
MDGIRIGMAGASANPLTGAVAPELARQIPVGVGLLAYPSRAPVFPYTPLDRALQVLGHVEAAQRAVAEGCDAVVLDSFGDYGLDILRGALSVPVVGCGDAALEEAARLGRTFALVTTWPVSMDFIVKRVLRDSGLEAGCRGILSIGGEEDLTDVSQPGGYLSRIAAGEAGILDRLRDACRHAVERNGAEVIVLGCTCLSSVAETVARDCSVPVVNPRLAGVRSALRQAAQDGARANPGFRAESLGVLKSMLDAVADTPPEACPTCVGDHLDPQAHPSRGA